MEPDPDEQEFPGEEELDWDAETANQFKGKKPKGLFSKTSEKARGIIPSERVCALFCGGKKCKYCSSEAWPSDQMVIKGLYSQWVTDNILAMARPSNDAIKNYDIVKQFKDNGINSIVNLQIPGEHADCGPHKLDPSGFLYNPQTFMEQGVFFYNFGWPDYGVASLSTILDMVKVMQFAVSQGKVAVHCHAGRGRTGVIIACYLVFTNRIGGRDAIHYVREKRPNSIQTRQQMLVIQEFEKYLRPFRIVFASKERGSHEFTLNQYLNRQRHILHGYEARRLKYVPKVIYTVCERILEIAKKGSSLQRLNSRNSLKNLDKTLSTIQSRSKQAQDSPVDNQKTKACLNSAQRTRKEIVTLGDTRNRFRSISLEDLPNSDFKDVLDEADIDSVGSGSMDKLSRDLNEEEDDDDEDDDNSIVFGHSAADLKALAGKDERTKKEMQHRDSGLSTMSDRSGVSDWTIDQMPSEDFVEKSVRFVAEALAGEHIPNSVKDEAARLECLLNETDTAWTALAEEKDPSVLSLVMWDWLDQLKEPVLRVQDLSAMLKCLDDPVTGLQKLEKGTRYTIEYLIKVLSKLKPLDDNIQYMIYEKLLSHLCQQWVQYQDSDFNSSWAMSTMQSEATEDIKEHWSEMKSKMTYKLFTFFFNLKQVLGKDKST